LWHRVFARSDVEPDPAALLSVIGTGDGAVDGGERGWERLVAPFVGAALIIERFWRDEEGIRPELQAWAAWIESCPENPHREPLMQHLIATQQVFTLRRTDNPETPGDVLIRACQLLARTVDGVYQVDGMGFFDADGTLLLGED
jgi:hypothetical protein